MKKLFLVFIILTSLQIGNSQTFEGVKNTVFFELLGNGLTGSFNYDTRLAGRLGGRIGIGYVGGSGTGVLTVPILANYLLGKNGRYFEIGAGVTILSGNSSFASSNISTTIGTMSFMYRSQPEDGGFMWKIGITPIIAGGVFVPYWIGLGLGYSF